MGTIYALDHIWFVTHPQPQMDQRASCPNEWPVHYSLPGAVVTVHRMNDRCMHVFCSSRTGRPSRALDTDSGLW